MHEIFSLRQIVLSDRAGFKLKFSETRVYTYLFQVKQISVKKSL
jgi:predicted AAA+ superfamily ATPase